MVIGIIMKQKKLSYSKEEIILKNKKMNDFKKALNNLSGSRISKQEFCFLGRSRHR